MQEKIDLSIVVAIYNIQEYLNECLDSVYRLNINKEIILIDDGSIDKSLEIASDYERRYPKETRLISKKNGGISSVRNLGLDISKGEYIYFIDGDDFIDVEKFENLFNEIKGTELEIIQGDLYGYKNEGIFIFREEKEKIKIENKVLNGKNFIDGMLINSYYKESVCLNIYRRSFLIDNKLKFQENLYHEDGLFSFIAMFKVNKMKYKKLYFYYYRQRENSIMTYKRRVLDYFYMYDKILDFILEEKINLKSVNNYIVSGIRSFSKEEKVYNKEILRKLWKLKRKDFKTFRNLIVMSIKGIIKLKNINYRDIEKIVEYRH